MPEFNIGHRKISLKDAFCKSDDRFRRMFAAQNRGTLTQITQDHLQIAEDHLDLDLVGDLVNLERYVKIGYRDKMGALSGDRLGAIGEALTWLEFRRQNRRLVRVVGTEPPAGPGRKLPRPDFIAREGSKRIRLVEVKSTDAYSASKLNLGERDDRPCEATRVAARDALRQLGVDSTELVQVGAKGAYELKVRDSHKLIPFPGDAATAVVWLARDQRLDVRGISTVVAEKSCIEKGRICATCVGTGSDALHLMMVTMPNSPDFVPTWPSNHRSDEWFDAYERWTRAHWLGHPTELELAADALWEVTTSWMHSTDQKWHAERTEPDESATTYHWWRHHLTTTVTQAGGFPQRKLWFDRGADLETPRRRRSVRRDVPSLTDPEDDAEPIQFGNDENDQWRWSLRAGSLGWDLRLQGPQPLSKVHEVRDIAWRALRLMVGDRAWLTQGDFPGLAEVRYGRALLGWTAHLTRTAWLGERGFGAQWDRPTTVIVTNGRCLRLSVHPDGRARLVMEGNG